ncbi:uncharacterized protein LOC116200080 [Punica granatum]|uniref:RING-CH-type domain-containing protein n=2 Tax=Punica granatum TaxID=22663 RepID=A0A218WA91_PUNGR|nr:uncharacterized protein LOC116200080 [Punica granatum]XP_031386618.1 uncharacterized protein LOC116200080 [Punica granatum]OWM69409.1 hypothetical protein CDL15_Pgr013870 [Punica granatum]PKI72666.1 hypothetical protein CRG98_007043 [Punica granatum]
MGKDKLSQTTNGEAINEGCSSSESNESGTLSRNSLEKEAGLPICRVCQCVESDKRGDIALEFLGITPPVQESNKSNGDPKADSKLESSRNDRRDSGFIEIISPEGEIYICSTDLEMGHQGDSLLELGCSCKSDLALVHYACALKWFINHGSTVCEICGHVAKNIRLADFKKVVSSLKDYEVLRERTASGEPNPVQVHASTGVDPDAVAAVRRQRLSEISLWFNPNHYSNNVHAVQNSAAASQAASEPPSATVPEDNAPAENPATKWAVEGTGILLATGLLTVTLAWLIAPRVGKKTAQSGLHILLGGVCALTVVVFFRFFVLTRIKYGPARYWAILFVFWFLVFGIWASRTHGAHGA